MEDPGSPGGVGYYRHPLQAGGQPMGFQRGDLARPDFQEGVASGDEEAGQVAQQADQQVGAVGPPARARQGSKRLTSGARLGISASGT